MRPALFALTLLASAPALAAGPELFAENCSACHQLTGKGIEGAFPALAGDPFVTGDPAKPVAVVLNGRGGMPTFRDSLDDAQIAAVLSYVRSAWGNKAGVIAPAFVAKLRGGADTTAKAADAMKAH
jgi:cytochrome c6